MNKRYVLRHAILAARGWKPKIFGINGKPKRKNQPMKKVTLLLAALTLAVSFTGCKSPAGTKVVVKSTFQIGVRLAANQDPSIIPYFRDYVAPVFCEAARGTNVQPSWIIAALENNAAAVAAKNENVVLVFDSLFAVYEGLFPEGTSNLPQAQAALEGACEGTLLGLPRAGSPAAMRRDARLNAPNLPPHLKWP